jgi:hypothetical protein
VNNQSTDTAVKPVAAARTPEQMTPKEIITEINRIQDSLADLENQISSFSAKVAACVAPLSPLVSNLRARFGINQAELYSEKLAKSRVAKLESGKESWTPEDIYFYMEAVNKIIVDRAAAFAKASQP